MAKFLRVLVFLAALWSLVPTGVLVVWGIALSRMADLFNGPHTVVILIICGLETALLFILYHAYRLQAWTSLGLLGWFILTSALAAKPFTLPDWLDCLGLLLIVMLPVTIVMILLAVHWVTRCLHKT
jgi:hypothetical protein